ncbi:MAG: hypothetical protein ACK4RM_07015 [Flavobacterium sp.]
MKNCPECNQENNDGVNQCKNCGFPFEKSTSKILFGNSEKSEIPNHEPKMETIVKPNLFQGRTEAEKGNAKFPDWDIVPPNQFINPRIKQQ